MRAYGVDTARYDPDFIGDTGLYGFVIQKATEGITLADSQFEVKYPEAIKLPINGAYHYLRSGMSGVTQADFFLKTIEGKNLDILAIDFESTNNTVDENFVRTLYDCLTRVSNQKPNTKTILYTNPDLYDNMIYPIAVKIWGKDIFTKWDLWIAQYFNYPLPETGHPILKHRLDWNIWQYSESGDASHNITIQDVDVFNGSIADMLIWVNKDFVKTIPYTGVEHYKLISNNVEVHIVIVDMKDKEAKMILEPNLKTVSNVAKDNSAQIAVNGHAWNWHLSPPYSPYGVFCSDGGAVINDMMFAPFLDIAKDNTLSIRWNDFVDLYNTTGSFRYLVQNGIPDSDLTDTTKIDNVELHARSAKGITKDGRLILVITDGSYTMTSGLTLKQLADVFVRFNTATAFANDSGGSSTLYIENEGGMQNTPSDPTERAVVSTLIIYTQGEINPMATYEVVSNKYNMSLRTDHNTGSTPIESVTMGTKMYADELFVAPSDLYKIINGVNTKIQTAGDIWAHIIEVNNVPKNLWTAIIHNGVTYSTYTDITPTPPTPTPTSLPTMHITIAANGYPTTTVDILPL
jgi:GH25 family lysozyme M1 (1,4-beta-N-acetylmuramidase)